jgi:hypothetical protein
MNTDAHERRGLVENCRLKIASWILGKSGWRKIQKPWSEAAQAELRRWEGCYDEAQARANRMREQADQWEKMAEEQRASRLVLEKRADGLLEECRQWEKRLKDVYYRRPAIVMPQGNQKRRDLERLMVLAGLDEKNDLWQVVLSYADEHEQKERESALGPDLTDDVRQYNAGRAAGAYDFATALRELFSEAQMEAKRLKGEG